jgi:hypothetical protein
MSNGGPARIIYYRGQMLTARDFEDQQEYHLLKHKQLLQRFPFGIVSGLEVKCVQKGDDPNDFDGFLIKEGLAIDREGNEIAVPADGFKEPVTNFTSEKPYLSLVYFEEEALVGDGFCGTSQKNNRLIEGLQTKWEATPNIGNSITVALIQLIDPNEPGSICANYEVIEEDVDGGPRIRIDAGVVGTEQLANRAVTVEKIGNNAITAEKITAGAITADKIAAKAVVEDRLDDDVIGRLVPNGKTHDHADEGFTKIPEGGLHPDVLAKLNAVSPGHDHTGGQEARIPTNGLVDGAVIREKIADRAVNEEKLDIIEELCEGSINGEPPPPLEFTIPTNAILQVIPTSGKLSWTFEVEFVSEGSLKYFVNIVKVSDGLVGYKVRRIALGTLI